MISADQRSAAMPRIVAITGATAYVGRAVARRFQDAGWSVVALSRSDPTMPGVRFCPWALNRESAIPTIRPDVVVHVAAAIMVDAPKYRTVRADLKGLARLLSECRSITDRTPRFILISSQSARSDAPSTYGRVKYAQEQYLDRDGEIIVRPGLVFGGEEKGVFRLLQSILAPLPVWPALATEKVFQPIHIDDLAEAVLRCAITDTNTKSYFLGAPEAMDFLGLLRSIARRSHKRSLIIPMPRIVTAIAIQTARLIRRSKLGERANGLLHLRAMDTRASLAELELQLRPLARDRNSGRRRSIAIAVALLAYVGGTRPRVSFIGIGPVKRLVRLCVDENLAKLPISRVMLGHPTLLRAIEPSITGGSDFSRALIAATWVYEMTSHGVDRFRVGVSRSPMRAVLSLGVTVAIEALLLPVRVLLGKMLRGRREPSGQSGPRSP